ncbi:hypothetical protein DSM104443_00279 [Usitatibacter rugosus]|uniref:Uncharacterized protein n=1 Tax=Usitatibacter rugosus TaxID=2732067 RepID=A0A6M4GPZ1_9PROT|nr:hypothetical protein [Usitatibacter rugosus]QJR09242.1 hypothetical protein DSM104443_00279 [Usitatibacter rugosus]
MKSVPFYFSGDDDGHFYALAWCDGFYVNSGGNVPSAIAIYFSPSPAFTRYSMSIHSLNGDHHLYHRGPDYTPAAEAIIIDGMVTFSVPPYAWTLVSKPESSLFLAGHEPGYQQARADLCRCLYAPRMKAWSAASLRSAPFFLPPKGGFVPRDAYADTFENQEFLQATIGHET